MGMKKIIKAIEAHVQDKVDDAYSEGYYHGHSDWDIQYGKGVRDERNRIINMFKMMSEMNMETGSAAKAKQYYEAAQLVRIPDDLQEQGIIDSEGNWISQD